MVGYAKSVNSDCIGIIGGPHGTSASEMIFGDIPEIDSIGTGSEILVQIRRADVCTLNQPRRLSAQNTRRIRDNWRGTGYVL